MSLEQGAKPVHFGLSRLYSAAQKAIKRYAAETKAANLGRNGFFIHPRGDRLYLGLVEFPESRGLTDRAVVAGRALLEECHNDSRPLLQDYDPDFGPRQIVGTRLIEDPGTLMTATRSLNDLIDKGVRNLDLDALSLPWPASRCPVGPAGHMFNRQYTATVQAAEFHVGSGPAGPLAAIQCVQYTQPYHQLSEVMRQGIAEFIAKDAERYIDPLLDDDEKQDAKQELVDRFHRSQRTQGGDPTFDAVSELFSNRILGLIKREAGLLDLRHMLDMTPTNVAGRKLLARFLQAVNTLRDFTDNEDLTESELEIVSPLYNGVSSFDFKASMHVAHAFDFLPIAAKLTGLLHEQRGPMGEIEITVGVRHKLNGIYRRTGEPSFLAQISRVREFFSAVQVTAEGKPVPPDENRLTLDVALHRLIVLHICTQFLEHDNANAVFEFEKLREILSRPEKDLLAAVADLLDTLTKSAGTWQRLADMVKGRLRSGKSLSDHHDDKLELSISKDLLDPLKFNGGQAIRELKPNEPVTRYLKWVTVSPSYRLRKAIVHMSIPIRLTHATVVPTKAGQCKYTIKRKLDFLTLPVNVITSRRVSRAIQQNYDEFRAFNAPISAYIVPKPEIDELKELDPTLFLVLQTILLQLTLDRLGDRLDILARQKNPDAPPVALAMMRYGWSDDNDE